MAPIIAAAKKKGVKFIDIYGIDVQHPELDDYQTHDQHDREPVEIGPEPAPGGVEGTSSGL